MKTTKRFGKLVVVSVSGLFATCRCDCGNIIRVWRSNLYGNSKSCGCSRRTAGGLYRANQSEYHSWQKMLLRCTERTEKSWKNYGGRGISVCPEWESFPRFLADMGKKPRKGYTIERSDNDGNYCKENCRWAPREEQARNTRRNRFIVLNGVRKVFAECLREAGINASTFYYRLARGIAPEEALKPATNLRYVSAFGKTQTLAAWGRECGIRAITIHMRMKRGWPVEKALTQKLR